MSPARSLCATPVKWGDSFCKATEEGASSAPSNPSAQWGSEGGSAPLLKCNNTGDPFRSGVLKVMSLARFLCATPVGDCDLHYSDFFFRLMG
jgi:hypothetical protein